MEHSNPEHHSLPATSVGVYDPRERQGETGSLNVKEYVTVLFKHKLAILVVFLLFVILSPAAYFAKQYFLRPAYEAKSSLLVRFGREYVEVDPDPSGKTPLSFGKVDIFATEGLILNSRELKERVIATIGMQKLFPSIVNNPPRDMKPLEAALIEFTKKLNVQAGRNSSIIDVAFTAEDPDVAAQAANMLVDFYRERRMSILSDPKSAFFLEQKATEYRQKLKESEDDLETFKQKHEVFSFNQEVGSLHQQRSQLADSIQTSETRMKEFQQKLVLLQNQIKDLAKPSKAPAGKVDIPVNTAPMETKLTELKLKESELLTKYTEKNALVVTTRNEIKTLEESIQKEKQKAQTVAAGDAQRLGGVINVGLNLRDELEKDRISTLSEMGSLEVRIGGLKQQYAELDKKIEALDVQEKRWRELERQVSLNEKYYQIYLNKLEEARISSDMSRQQMTSVQVIQPAVPPALPNTKLMQMGLMSFMAAGSAMGVVAGIAFAFLLGFMSQSISTPQEAEKHLNLPTLASIPYKD